MLSLFSFYVIFKCDFYAYFAIMQFCRLVNIFLIFEFRMTLLITVLKYEWLYPV